MGDFAVYRLRDAENHLLYVGMSESVFVRLEQHVKRQRWWPKVDHAEIEWFASYAEMVDAELHAIRTEAPMHNIQGLGGRHQCRATPEPPTPITARETFHRLAS